MNPKCRPPSESATQVQESEFTELDPGGPPASAGGGGGESFLGSPRPSLSPAGWTDLRLERGPHRSQGQEDAQEAAGPLGTGSGGLAVVPGCLGPIRCVLRPDWQCQPAP